MSAAPFQVLGLAPARVEWFTAVARWSTGALLPVVFDPCLSVDELRARLASGRTYSAVLVDRATTGIDRDLIGDARRIGAAVVVVDRGASDHDWSHLGASATLEAPFEPDQLLQVLQQHAPVPVGPSSELHGRAPLGSSAERLGRLIAVTGAGGTGTSVAAMAVARGLGERAERDDAVVLADFALDADQAMLHASADVMPGLQELLDVTRRHEPDAATIASVVFAGPPHPYRLLLGLRRHQDWTMLRPRSVEAMLTGLRRHHEVVVADVDVDVEGAEAAGSVDVEERNLLARTTTIAADVVVVTGHGGVQGVHRLARALRSLLDHGVAVERLLPVVMRAPRNPRARAEISRAVVALAGSPPSLGSPLHLPALRHLDRDLWDGRGAPTALSRPLADAVLAFGNRVNRPDHGAASSTGVDPAPVLVRPGSLGRWADATDVAR